MSFLPNDVLAEQEVTALKLTVLKKAAEIVGTHHPLSATSRIAVRVLHGVMLGMIRPHGEDKNDPTPVADLIGGFREVVRQDPDNAGRWAWSLKELLRVHRDLTDPASWEPSAVQIMRAREFLSVSGDAKIDARFDSDGNLIARGGQQNTFVIIPETKDLQEATS